MVVLVQLQALTGVFQLKIELPELLQNRRVYFQLVLSENEPLDQPRPRALLPHPRVVQNLRNHEPLLRISIKEATYQVLHTVNNLILTLASGVTNFGTVYSP